MVTLYVKAKNEFAPVFQHSNYTVNISEATAIGKYIREFSFSKFHGRIAPLSIGLRENKNLPSEKITTLNYWLIIQEGLLKSIDARSSLRSIGNSASGKGGIQLSVQWWFYPTWT